MTTPDPNGASQQQPDHHRVAQRAAQAAASAAGDLAVQYAMAVELAEMRGARILELEQTLANQQVDNARVQQTLRSLEAQLDEVSAELAAREGDEAQDMNAAECEACGDTGETGTTPEGSAHGDS